MNNAAHAKGLSKNLLENYDCHLFKKFNYIIIV